MITDSRFKTKKETQIKLKTDAEVKLQNHNYLGNKKSDSGPGVPKQKSGVSGDEPPRLDRKIHMKTTEFSEPQEQKDNNRVFLAVNSASGLGERTKRREDDTPGYENTAGKAGRTKMQSEQTVHSNPKKESNKKGPEGAPQGEDGQKKRQKEKYI